MYSRRWHTFTAGAAVVFVLSITDASASGFAQTAEGSADQQQTHDPSELAPAPSTWKVCIGMECTPGEGVVVRV